MKKKKTDNSTNRVSLKIRLVFTCCNFPFTVQVRQAPPQATQLAVVWHNTSSMFKYTLGHLVHTNRFWSRKPGAEVLALHASI